RPADVGATADRPGAPPPDRRGNARPGQNNGTPRAAETTDLPPSNRDCPPVPSSGYVYPTARERRAAAEAAARPEGDRQRKSVAGEPGVEAVAGVGSPCPASHDHGLHLGGPPPASTSSPPDAGALRAALKELFGYDTFRPGQEAVVRHVLEGRSVL